MREIRRRPGATQSTPPDAIDPLLWRLYGSRGVTEAAQLDLSAARLLPPEQLLNCNAAATLLADALQQQLRILVVGDFDADGATSSALAVSALRQFGAAAVDFLVPNRFEYGYGLTPEIVALASARKPDIIITVDNGISSIEGVAAASALGIRTLVTDHHLPGERLPEAAVIVNPNQAGCGFPSKNLAGVGVIFYVLLALRAVLRERDWFAQRGIDEPGMGQFLDLVALGTVADVVPLDHNNRILVENGLRRIRRGGGRPGIEALLQVAGRDPTGLVASDLGFAVGPRLNAAGRLDDMAVGIRCLLADSAAVAQPLAAQLNQLNLDRRAIEQNMQGDAEQQLSALLATAAAEPPLVLVLFDQAWHQGVIGILASRVKERLHRPCFAFAPAGDGQIKGSARSIPGLHIRDVLADVDAQHPGLIAAFGGHAMAAGLTLADESRLDRFRDALLRAVQRHAEDVELQAVLESDGELEPQSFTLATASSLRYAGPWGQHFPEPVFDGRFRVLQQRIVGGQHLKLVLSPEHAPQQALDAIAFRVDTERWPDPGVTEVDVAYRLDVNQFRGQQTLQLMVEQLEPVGG